MTYVYGTEEYERAYMEELAKKMESHPPPYVYLSVEWVGLYEKAVREDAYYREAAKDWEGSVALQVEANPEYGIDTDIFILLDLWHGDCRRAWAVPREVGESADYIVTGSADRWMEVGRRKLDIIKGLMQGKLKLKGDLPTIVRNVKAATRLVEISTMVGGKYPDELSPEEVENLRAEIADMRERFLG